MALSVLAEFCAGQAKLANLWKPTVRFAKKMLQSSDFNYPDMDTEVFTPDLAGPKTAYV